MTVRPERRRVLGRLGLTCLGALLAATGTPGLGSAQWGDLRLEVGGSRAFPPSGSDAQAATYVTAGLRVDRWTPSGSGVYAGVFGGLAADSPGGDWASFIVGGEAVAGSGGPVEFSLSAFGQGFTVGRPFAYEALTVQARPELRFPVGRVTIVLYGEGGKGSSDLEFHRGDLVRTFTQDLWHYGGGPELQLRLEQAVASASWGVLETENGTFRRGEIQVSGGKTAIVEATLRVWDTPFGAEATGTLAVTVPMGRSWFARLLGGRTDPDPLVQTQPGGQGGVVIGTRLIRFGPPGGTPIVALRPLQGETLARFRIEAGSAQRVELLGDFSAWEPKTMIRDGKVWTLEMVLPSGTHHFGFLVDGEWFVPERAPGRVSDDWGQMNATIVVP